MYYLLILCSLILPFQIFSEGRLIEVCGIDGAGKSTFIQDLNEALTANGRKVIVLKPLSGDPMICKFLDELDALKNNIEDLKLHERIDQFKSEYFFLGLLANKPIIDRYLLNGYDILCDRYLFSFKTYQESFNQSIVNEDSILNNLPKEHLIFLLTVPIDVAIDRIEKKGNPTPYENPIFLGKAQKIFLRELNRYPHLVHLNGNEPRESNIQKALSLLEER
jgi:thymidylate kinase